MRAHLGWPLTARVPHASCAQGGAGILVYYSGDAILTNASAISGCNARPSTAPQAACRRR